MVPIFRQTTEWSKRGAVLRRTQFPLVLAYAITIHKSQGLTVEKAVLNISEADFAPGLTYVAVSRVKSLNGLMFEEPFDLQGLQKKDGTTIAARKMDECLRLTQQVKDKVRRLTKKVKTAANFVQDDFNPPPLAA